MLFAVWRVVGAKCVVIERKKLLSIDDDIFCWMFSILQLFLAYEPANASAQLNLGIIIGFHHNTANK